MSNTENRVIRERALSFDDVLIIPQRSDVFPHQVDIQSPFSQRIHLKNPFVSAAMDMVTESKMAITIAQLGGIGVLHKNLPIDEQIKMLRAVKSAEPNNANATLSLSDPLKLAVGVAIGYRDEDLHYVERLIAEKADALVIDTAHGHYQNVIEMVKKIRNFFGNEVEIVAGNIVTEEAAIDLIEVGVNALKIGVGPGSICTTRVVVGVGVPQFTAICNVQRICHAHNVPIIADGGIKTSGDVAKAIGAGASTVMIGSLFAGTFESPGDVFERGGKQCKRYRGMGSATAMSIGITTERYFQQNSNTIPQGVEGIVEVKGNLQDVLHQLESGLRSAMGFTGSRTITDFWERCKFVEITRAGYAESHPHSLLEIADWSAN